MTTLFPESVKCALCGTDNEVMIVGSTSAFGHMDLDMRPPPLKRNILGTQVQRCSNCGYCSIDISSADGDASSMVGSADYEALLADERFPNLARSFRALSHITEADGNFQMSVLAQLRAAWACDDRDGYPEAAECRRETLRLLDRLHEQGQTFCEDLATDQILKLDLLRRSGQFAAVSILADAVQAGDLPDHLAQITSFQAERANAKDRACYTVDAAFPD